MTAIFREIVRLPEFEKDLKKLLKRFPSLESDLENLIKAEIGLLHKLKIDNKGVFQLSGLPFQIPKVFKVKKFACRSLKGKGAQSGLRLIYSFFEEEDKIELIQLYYKSDKENEDKERIIGHYR